MKDIFFPQKNRLLHFLLVAFFLTNCHPTTALNRTSIYFVTHAAYDLEALVTQFETAHPDIRVHVSYRLDIPEDWPRHFDGALLANAPVMYPEQANLLLDLMPLIETDIQFDIEDYYPGALATGDLNGRRVAIPINLSFDALVYDPRQLTEAGAALPTEHWTWKDLMNSAGAIAHYQAGQGSGTVFVNKAEWHHLLVNWLNAQVPLFRKIDDRLLPELDRPELQSAVSNVRAALPELTTTADPNLAAGRPLARLQAGEAAMTMIHSLGRLASQRSSFSDLAVTALPHPNIYGDMQANGTLAVSRGTAHRQSTWQWIRFLSRQHLPNTYGYDLPARSSIAQEQRLWETLDPQMAQVIHTILAAQDGAKIGQNQEPLWSLRSHLVGALVQVYDQRADPFTALTEAQQQAMDEISTWYDEQDNAFKSFSVASSPGADKTETVETLRVSMSSQNLEQTFLALAKEFEASHPGWSVQVAPLSGMTQVESAFFQVNSFETSSLLNMQQVFLPLQTVSELAPLLTNDAFFPQAVEAVSWRGQLLGIPMAIRPLLLYYDAQVFMQLGLSPPTSDWTVTDMLNAAQAIVAAEPGLLGYAAHSGTELRFVLEQQGISLFSDQQPYPHPRFAELDVLQAIERLRALQGGQAVVPFGISAVMELPTSLEEPLCHHSSPMKAVALQPYPGTRWPVQVYVNGVPQQSPRVQMAWEWITFLTTQGKLHGRALPALRAQAEAEATHQMLGSELYTAYMTALKRDVVVPSDRETMIVQDAASFWFDRALYTDNTETFQAALEQAQANAKEFIDCLATASTMDAQSLAACAGKVDPGHPLAGMAP